MAYTKKTWINGEVITADGLNRMEDGIAGAELKHSRGSLVLTAAGWSNNAQTVTAANVTAGNDVLVTPAPASQDAYTAAGIKCTAQAKNALTFTCATVPSENLTVNFRIMPA